jgi:signal transduction histidine kinase
MLRWLRYSKISLAVKCQILFGAAVVMIIAAALYWPWQRMEQLTGQLNERAAAAVARQIVAEHVSRPNLRPATTHPATTEAPPAPTTTQVRGEPYLPPRFIAASARSAVPDRLTRFERSAMERFISDSDKTFFARDYDNGEGYRYAQPLFASADCVRCHQQNLAALIGSPAPARSATTNEVATSTAPTTQTTPQTAQLLGIVSVDIPSQISTNQLILNRVFILTAGLLAGTLAVIIFYLITTKIILQPVRVLQETAEKVSEGDLNIRSDISTGDEFQQLSETFNTMLINLKAGADQLKAVNKSLDLRLGQLAESNVALFESNRLKSEFLANVSHELRTPLNSILGFTELLRDLTGQQNDPKVIRYIHNITRSGNHLLDLINDLLDLAKIEAGKMEVRSEPLTIADMFEALINLLKPISEPKGLTISPNVASGVPIIHTDPAKLQQVLYNFLSNAIKFSPDKGSIELSADLEGLDQVRISVTDHGPGIAPEQHAVIFEKFRQIDASVTRQHGGTGLGLAISKELASLLGGSIGVRSAPGEGATFWIILPLRIEAGAQDVRSGLVLT